MSMEGNKIQNDKWISQLEKKEKERKEKNFS